MDIDRAPVHRDPPRVTAAMLGAALDRVPSEERAALLHVIELMHKPEPSAGATAAAFRGWMNSGDVSRAGKLAAALARHLTRMTAGTDARGLQGASLDDIRRRLQRPEAAPALRDGFAASTIEGVSGQVLPELEDAEFVRTAHETILGRGCQPAELVNTLARLRERTLTRQHWLATLVAESLRVSRAESQRASQGLDGFHIMGSGRFVSRAEWEARRTASVGVRRDRPVSPARASSRRAGSPRISVITSLYAGGAFIERFMRNMLGQSGFDDGVELIIIDADSPDDEAAVIKRLAHGRANVRYRRINHRIGIYDAWNMAVGMATGDYLTNANVDDLRREDSLERQAEVLDQLPFVDVVYQDFFYTLDASLDFAEVAEIGFLSDLPVVTPATLMRCNPPHNAPMWRRCLHDELGLFDTRYRSAGDYEFWMRCAVAGKTFHKINEATVAYFQNPHGISTRPDTAGHEETRRVHREHGRAAVPALLNLPPTLFAERYLGLVAAPEEDFDALTQRALLACAGRQGASPP